MQSKPTICDRYAAALRNLPSPGGGGCHSAIMRVANLGILAGIVPDRLFAEIGQSIPRGGRAVPDAEIQAAVQKAAKEIEPVAERREFTPAERRAWAADKARRAWAAAEKIPPADLGQLWERSPIRLTDDPSADAAAFLRAMFWANDLIWVGDIRDTSTPAARDIWCERIEKWGFIKNFVCINPLSGERFLTVSGRRSFRCDAAVAAHRHVLVEFDMLDIDQQAGRVLWMLDQKWPVAAVVHSGGKSLHVWLRINLPSAAAWRAEVPRLFSEVFGPLGADVSCKNPSRLARLPGVLRPDTGEFQQIFYLARSPPHEAG